MFAGISKVSMYFIIHFGAHDERSRVMNGVVFWCTIGSMKSPCGVLKLLLHRLPDLVANLFALWL